MDDPGRIHESVPLKWALNLPYEIIQRRAARSLRREAAKSLKRVPRKEARARYAQINDGMGGALGREDVWGFRYWHAGFGRRHPVVANVGLLALTLPLAVGLVAGFTYVVAPAKYQAGMETVTEGTQRASDWVRQQGWAQRFSEFVARVRQAS